MGNYKDIDDAACLVSFKNGDISAFEEIYNRYWFQLYGVAFRQTQSKQEAEEMVQTVFERIWKNRDNVIINNIGGYLTVSLRNVLIDFFRQKESFKKRSMPFLNESFGINAGEEKVNHNQLINSIEEVLQQLPEKTQTVFRLSRFEDRSVKEIAIQLNLSEKAVEYHITRSLKLLRKYLSGYQALFFIIFFQMFRYSC